MEKYVCLEKLLINISQMLDKKEYSTDSVSLEQL